MRKLLDRTKNPHMKHMKKKRKKNVLRIDKFYHYLFYDGMKLIFFFSFHIKCIIYKRSKKKNHYC